MARVIYATRAFADGWQLAEVAPGPEVTSRSELEAWVIENVGSYYHFAGSCKMGSDPMAVVDPQLRVRGVQGLRIADASIMPAVTSSNPHTTVVMIGERAADLIKQTDFINHGESR
jgi:choline dehydrogenase